MAHEFAVEGGDETDATDARTCPECSGTVRMADYETTCTDCGLVLDEDRIDHGPEWRSFNDDETDRSRVGAPRTTSRHDKGLSTDFYTDRDGHGQTLSGKKQRQLQRLRTHHSRARFDSRKERNQCYVFNEIRRMTSALGMANLVRDRACDLFRTAHKERLTKGRTLEGFATACVYATCRCLGLPWQLDDFEAVARCSRRRTKIAFDVMNDQLSLPVMPVAPRKFVPRYAAELGVSDATRRRARLLVEHYEDDGLLVGQAHAPIAAAALYLVADENGERFSQAEAARVAECCSVTIRDRYREFLQIRNHL